MPPPRRPLPPRRKPSGLGARDAVVACLGSILDNGRPLDDAFEAALLRAGPMEPRDRAFARLLVMTVLRRKGELDAVLASFLERPLSQDSGRLKPILLSAAAQLLILETPPHAAINLAVEQCRADRKAHRFDKLTNAVLRRVSEKGKEILAGLDPVTANIPPWLLGRWQAAYGAERAREIALASLGEATLDLSVKDDARLWADRLGGDVLPTGTVRLRRPPSRVDELAGFAEGAWWVQDAAAALPTRLLGNVKGSRIADLCAAPGGKTAELLAAGAEVVAVEKAPARITRLKENLTRLKLEAEVVEADLFAWAPEGTFEAVLLDAPCSATGTIRRHPDILHLRRKDDTSERTNLQRRMLDRAADLVAPDGLLVYCTCSLEPEEGERQIADFLSRNAAFERMPIAPGEAGIDAAWITDFGDLRTLPQYLPNPDPELAGMDGFFAARLKRQRQP